MIRGQWLEVEAKVKLGSRMFGVGLICCRLQNYRVCWFTDNQNVVRIILCGSRKAALQEKALEIFVNCVNYKVRLDPKWVPTYSVAWHES